MSDLTPGRNEPCPCGSGRKFKRCCGAIRAKEASPALLRPRAVPREIPTIVNNDGDLLVQTRSLYEVADPVSLLVEVESWRPKPQIERERGPDRRLEALEAHYQRKPRAGRAAGERVLVARLEWRRGEHLIVETNSSERDLEIREKLALLPPSDIRFLRTEGNSMYELLSQPVSEEELRRAGEEQEEFSRRPEVSAKLSEIMRDYSRRWCDEVIPALGNRRPRTLVKTEAGRAKVLALLEDFERTPAPPGPGGMDCALIRRELGLPPGR